MEKHDTSRLQHQARSATHFSLDIFLPLHLDTHNLPLDLRLEKGPVSGNDLRNINQLKDTNYSGVLIICEDTALFLVGQLQRIMDEEERSRLYLFR